MADTQPNFRVASPVTIEPTNFAGVARLLAKRRGFRWAELTGGCRAIDLIIIRQAVAWVGVRVCGKSHPYVGQVLNRDHTTILYSVRKIDRFLERIGVTPPDDPVEAGVVIAALAAADLMTNPSGFAEDGLAAKVGQRGTRRGEAQ